MVRPRMNTAEALEAKGNGTMLPDAGMAAMLRHLGCTAYASVEAEVAGDDIALRRGLHRRRSLGERRRGDRRRFLGQGGQGSRNEGGDQPGLVQQSVGLLGHRKRR